jgi:hypothetical protein
LTAREHLKSHHERCAIFHKDLAKRFTKRAEALDGDDKEFHEGLAKAHTEHAEYHEECCKDLDKAVAADLNKTVPSRASGIPGSDAPDDNPHSFGKRLVIKPGSRDELKDVDPVLHAVLGGNDDQA